MNKRRVHRPGWALLAMLAWTSGSARAGALVRDVRPHRLAPGDTLIVECPGLAPGQSARVVVNGKTGHGPVTIEAPAKTSSGDRVLVSGDDLFAQLNGTTRLEDVSIDVLMMDGARCATAPGLVPALALSSGAPRALSQALAESPWSPRVPRWALDLAVMGVLALVLHLLVAPLTGVITVWERKIAGRMQSRLGPNRTGPSGWLQWLADALKLITKEDLIPTDADPLLFRLSPYLVWMSVFATFVVLPLSPTAAVADLDAGVLYLLSVTTFVVIAILMGGWASNSKWSLLGGMRSAAQIISYELPASVALLQVVLLAGSLSAQDIVRAQGGLPHQWFVFSNPFSFVCFFIYFISALAEGNRAPFDLPEAESELVSGYNTEYSGFRFSIYFLAEWTNMVVVGAIVAALFLGGWNVPFVDAQTVGSSPALHALGIAIMLTKVVTLVFVIIWIRWTLPRLRMDQMMALCWKYLVPFSFVAFIGTAAWMWLVPQVPLLTTVVPWLLFLIGGAGGVTFFFARVLSNFRSTRLVTVGDRQFSWPFVEPSVDRGAPPRS